jgi:hypothetical protein
MTNQIVFKAIILALSGALGGSLLWTGYYLSHVTHPDLDDDPDEHPGLSWRTKLKVSLHWRLKTVKLAGVRDIVFFVGNERNYRHEWLRCYPKGGATSAKLIQERIVGSAIRHPEGLIYATGYGRGRHFHVIGFMDTLGQAGLANTMDQGFITSHGRYVNRRHAMVIARHAAQVTGTTSHTTKLFSEDVW